MKATNNKQEPFIYGSLGGGDVALVPTVAVPAAATNVTDSNASERRDYELTERVGAKEAWDSFLAVYPNGFYAKLAQAQRNKLVADEARASAAERKRAAEEVKAAETERAKAAARAQAEEEARLATQKAGKLAEEKANQERIAAEKKKAVEETKAAEKVTEAERARVAAQAKADEEARLAAEKAKAREQNVSNDKPIGQIAVMTPPNEAAPKSDQAVASSVSRLLQTELHRLGCGPSASEDNWGTAAQKALGLFNKNAGTRFDVKVASIDALEVLRSKSTRVCPLICDHGFKADGDSCAKIVCKAGYVVGDDNTCEKIEPRRAAKPQPATSASPAAERPVVPRESRVSSSGLMACSAYCSQKYNGQRESRCLSFAGRCDHSR